MNLLVFTCAVIAFLLYFDPSYAEEKEDIMEEQTTESPIADMALVEDSMKADAVKAENAVKTPTEKIKKVAADSQQHTIADFIIHPLIALKPRVPDTASAKQADTNSSTPWLWQLFGLNPGQGLGSSVTGWLGNHIQLPGFVDTPVRVSSTTSTTTERPDLIIRVKQRASTKKPLISINNKNDRPFRKNKRRNNFNNYNFYESEDNFDSDKYDDDDEDFNRRRVNRRRYQEDQEDNYDEYFSTEHDDDTNNVEEEADDYNEDNGDFEEEAVENYERRKPMKNISNQKKRINNSQRKQQLQKEDSAEEDQYDDNDENEEFYYSKNQYSKRSKNEPTFIQRSQQSLLNQIRHLTRIQSPAEEVNSVRKSLRSNNKKRRQQATFLITRDGQTIYVAPELLEVSDDTSNEVNEVKQRLKPQFPQPPLTVPYRKKGQPTQYITIPWSQLGISPPDQVTSLTEGVQAQPLILNIPQGAIDNMQNLGSKKKQQVLTANAVPLLAEASIMDIFEPPHIPPSRLTPISKPTKKPSTGVTPVVIATKLKPGRTRIRSSTTIEKAPAPENKNDKNGSADDLADDSKQTQFFVIGEEFGDTKLNRNAYKQILDYFNQNRVGRQLDDDSKVASVVPQTVNHFIPVQVVPERAEPLNEEANANEMTMKSSMDVENSRKDSMEEI